MVSCKVIVECIVSVHFLFGYQFCIMLMSFYHCRYTLDLSKTVKTDIYYYNSESMHRPIDCYSKEIVTTYKTLMAH
jgi:hypothetical protein